MQLIINGYVITEPIESIIYALKREANWDVFKHIEPKDDYLRVTCPFHKDGHESHPSCSIYTSYDSDSILPGTFHCFSCGESATLYQAVAHILNISEDEAKDWLINKYGDWAAKEDLYFPAWEPPEIAKNTTYLDENILEQYKYYHPYMAQRKIPLDVVKKFTVGYNQEKNTITFPVWDEDDHLVMITERSVTNKTFYIPKNIEKPIYLFNFIKKEMPNFLFICESQINALTCWSYNLPAVALIGTGTEKQYDILRKSGIRNYILCFDGDNAGRKGAARFKKALAKTETSITDIIMPDGKDVNDLSKEEFKIILQNYGLNLIS